MNKEPTLIYEKDNMECWGYPDGLQILFRVFYKQGIKWLESLRVVSED